MMKNNFYIEILKFSNLLEIEGAWKSADFAALLDETEFGDTSQLADTELREMCIMSLQDQEPDEAAYILLKHVIGGDLRDGQLRNMSHEMLTEKLWEEYVDPAFHERLFNVGSILYEVLPRSVPKPDAVRVNLKITASDLTSRQSLNPSPTEALIVRMLADGMGEHAVLHRLYSQQLAGKSFPNAAEVVWIIDTQPEDKLSLLMNVTGSGYWLDALEGTKSYSSHAYSDEAA